MGNYRRGALLALDGLGKARHDGDNRRQQVCSPSVCRRAFGAGVWVAGARKFSAVSGRKRLETIRESRHMTHIRQPFSHFSIQSYQALGQHGTESGCNLLFNNAKLLTRQGGSISALEARRPNVDRIFAPRTFMIPVVVQSDLSPFLFGSRIGRLAYLQITHGVKNESCDMKLTDANRRFRGKVL